MPEVSVVIGAYNCGRTIQETVYSVINQTFEDWELVIVDDGSSDDTYEKIKNIHDSRIKIIRLDKNSGLPAVSRNIAIQASTGEFVAFLDHDDIWHKEKLKKQLIHFRELKIVGVASNAVLISDNPYYRECNLAGSKRGYADYEYKDLLNRNFIITSSLIVRRQVLDKSGFFDESKDLFCIEDWDLWLKMARHGLFRVLKDPLLFYLVSRKRGDQCWIISKNCFKVLEKQASLGYVKNNDIKEPTALIYLAIARNLLEFDQKQSREYYVKALKATSNMRRKIKSYVGMMLSFSPPHLMKTMLLIMYKTEQMLRSIKSCYCKGTI